MTTETEDKVQKKNVADASVSRGFAVEEEKRLDLSKKTHGEKRFDQINWVMGYIVTFAASVGIAYLFRDSSLKFPFKKKLEDGTKVDQSFAEWTAGLKHSFENSSFLARFKNADVIPEEQKKHFDNKRLAGIVTNTLVTFPGGFLMLPVERALEKNKQNIVRWFNKRTGDEDQVAIGDARTKDHRVSGWGSLLLGRLTALVTVLASFMTLEVLIPKTMGGIEKDFENWFVKAGDKVSKWRTGNPMDRDGKAYKRWFGLGNLSAIDSIATAASVTVVLMANTFFKGEKKHDHKPVEKRATSDYGAIEIEKRVRHEEEPSKRFTEETPRAAKPQQRGEYAQEAEREKASQPMTAVAY